MRRSRGSAANDAEALVFALADDLRKHVKALVVTQDFEPLLW